MKANYFLVLKTVFKSKAYLFFVLVFLSTSVLTSCGEDDVKVEDPKFEIVGNPSGVSVDASGSTTSYQVRSNRAWKIVAKESGDWAKASPIEGKDNGSFNIIVQENKTFEKRVMNFAFVVDGKEQSGKLRVEQSGLTAFLKITDGKDGLSVVSDGGKVLIGVDSNTEWTYTLDDKTWLTESKMTNSQLEFTAVPNKGATVRKATATITSASLPGFSAKVIITQAAGASLKVPSAIDGLSVISAGGKVLIGVEGNVEWTYTLDDKTWLTESKKTNTELEFTAKANTGWEVRKATATITSASIPGFSAKVLITQASGAFLNVAAEKDGLKVIAAGGKVSIPVESNMKWKYTLDDKTWLSESMKDDSKIEFTAVANTGEVERKVTVTITSEVLPAFTKKVVITQAPKGSGSGDTPKLPPIIW